MNSSYRVRTACVEDLLAVLRLYEHSPTLEQDTISGRQRDMWQRMMATDDLTVYVAETDGEVVGTSCLLVMPNLTYDCCPTAFIEAVVVADAHRRRGVARMMLGRLLDDARSMSCRKVQLLTHKRHAGDGAHDLYRSCGFEAEAEGFRLYLDPAGVL
ncbi:MAG: GNAT family N-acetyltransferase [Candidatus Dormibacteraeota bacterium]|uniref:GNAT family N-acetyltransferase n=1 Tax=Candidatus Amunia macphersoniae TaxID=3127014 RepID=A0A934KGF5_9BACT|nr:GNAT family N-acetyltransferase [Candidatus Dormibacteraeota bacterium]